MPDPFMVNQVSLWRDSEMQTPASPQYLGGQGSKHDKKKGHNVVTLFIRNESDTSLAFLPYFGDSRIELIETPSILQAGQSGRVAYALPDIDTNIRVAFHTTKLKPREDGG